METQTTTSPRVSAKDVFLNLGAIVALYTVVGTLIHLLFTVINEAFPQITYGYSSYGSSSISWSVATLIIFFPIFILIMWFLEKEYTLNPEKQYRGVHKWLSYLTLFISGLMVAGDLVTVLYYFIDGQELTTGFLLKILVLFVIGSAIFSYYLADVRMKLTAQSRTIYRVVALGIVLGSIVWGFSVLGSPHTQRLYKYDEEKVNALMNINNDVQYFFEQKDVLPKNLEEIKEFNHMNNGWVDPQNQKSYEYVPTGALTYDLCAEFNKPSKDANSRAYYYDYSWDHQAGHVCFHQSVAPVELERAR